jgi:hypothetical protein
MGVGPTAMFFRFAGDGERPNFTSLLRSLNDRFSGDGRREDARDSSEEPKGPGMRLPGALRA